MREAVVQDELSFLEGGKKDVKGEDIWEAFKDRAQL